MSEENNTYSGFVLKVTKLDVPNLPIIIRVACFKPRSEFRRILPLKVEKSYEFDFGQIIHFSPRNGELEENTLVIIHEGIQPFSEHRTEFHTMIIHILKDVSVSAEDLPAAGIYKHPDLGIMKDEESRIKTGIMDQILIKVLVIKDGFEIEVLRADHRKFKTPQEEVISDLKKMENIHEIRNHEHQINKKNANLTWERIGLLKLTDFNKTNIQGYRPVFELLDGRQLELFNKQKRNNEVAIIQVKKVGGNYRDVSDIQLGTLIENQEGLPDMRVMAHLKAPYRHKFERTFEIGALFRFESAHSEKTFKEKQSHKDYEHFEHTLYRSTEQEELMLLDVIDSGVKLEGEVLKDEGFQQDELNETQNSALKMALNEKRKVVCIQGGPGTGKTYVLAHLLAVLLFKNKQAIVLAPTKEALKNVMNMTEKVFREKNLQFHDKTLMDQVKFEQAVNDSPAAKDAQKKIAQWDEEFKNKKLVFEEFYEMRKHLINCTLAEAGTEIMKQTRFVFATIQSSFVSTAMRYKIFDPSMCVIDHAEQVMETKKWPGELKMKRIVMAGDPKQLGALVLSPEAKAAKLEESIMDRIIHNKQKFSWIMLVEQYRCHPKIIEWSKKSFYGDALENRTNEKNTIHTSFQFEAPTSFRQLFDAVALVDTSAEKDSKNRESLYEQISKESDPNEEGKSSKSYINKGEARLVILHYMHLRELGIEAKNIAIITPYKGQVELIKQGMANLIKDWKDLSCTETKIETVDSVQGQEFDCVIFSMVRSNPRKTMGFVSDLRRLNVLMTRAKRHLMFIGNAYLMANSWQTPIQNLFHELNENRFHPKHVGYQHAELWPRVTDNFGFNFEVFVKASNDPDMIKWCAEYVENQSKPGFMQQQREKKAKQAKTNNRFSYN